MGIEEFLLDRAERQGLEKGLEKGCQDTTYKFVKNLLLSTDFPVEKIAGLAEVSETFVKELQHTLQ